MASPEDGVVRTEAEISKDEILDFEMVSKTNFTVDKVQRKKSIDPI